ncbi:MAG: efflux RND transporter periplasmic adaptor subunit [Candidatus Aminicenantes bacterium]|nr:efflux RND transporter periplasmic adaptor subunit [Candidatus Aminicenantes bacterium]
MKKKVWIGAAILVAVVLIVIAVTTFNRNKTNGIKFKKEAVKKGDIEALVVTTGSLNPVTTVDVGSQVSGRIDEIYVDFNSVVKSGQVIAKIDQSSFLARLKQNEANYKSTVAAVEKAKVTLMNDEKQYNRALDLFKKELISFEEKDAAETKYYSSQADLQSAQARLEQAKSQLDSSQVELDFTIIKSPIDGVVINRSINVGQTVAASFQAPVLFQIANDLSKMQVECSVDEADIGKVEEGQKVRFTVDAFPDENFSGIVSQVRYSPEVIQNVVTYTTIVAVANPELKLRPGMTATVSVVVGEARDKLLIPNSALRFNPDLSPEEMMEIFTEMREEWQSKRIPQAQAEPSGEQPSTKESRPSKLPTMIGGGQGLPMGQMKGVGRVWIEDDKGKLKMILIRTGVTDNTYTEVLKGPLVEGQEVITGTDGSSGDQDANREAMRRGMFLMRPR